MSAWNFDMAQAPKGWPLKRSVLRKGEVVFVDDYEHVKILAAGNGGVVTATRWLPDEKRWEMFSKDTPPIAWQPWPDHPHADGQQ